MKLQPKENDEIEIDMSPMIDMVFLLLIFFIVTSTVIVDKVPIEEIPMAVHATVADGDKENRVVVSINRDEEVFFGVNKTPISFDDLKGYLQRAKIEDEKLRVMIRCDGGVKYEVNEKVMAVCGEAGAMDLIYAVFEGAEENL